MPGMRSEEDGTMPTGEKFRVKGILEKLKVKILFGEKLKRIRTIKKLTGH
jgi:hypothetical protein